jgi:hypothetical protein
MNELTLRDQIYSVWCDTGHAIWSNQSCSWQEFTIKWSFEMYRICPKLDKPKVTVAAMRDNYCTRITYALDQPAIYLYAGLDPLDGQRNFTIMTLHNGKRLNCSPSPRKD